MHLCGARTVISQSCFIARTSREWNINKDKLTSQLALLNARRRVASLSMFYRYYHGHCVNSIAELMPRPAEICHPLRNRKAWHPYRVHLCRARTVTSQSCFIARTSRDWNLLLYSVFPPEYDLQSFKSKVNKHIMIDLKPGQDSS